MITLVTGCAGFIGQKVTEKLLQGVNAVIGVDNLNDYYDPCFKQWRLLILWQFDRFVFYQQDIEDYNAMEKLFKTHKFDTVFNLAARAGFRASVENPWIYLIQ